MKQLTLYKPIFTPGAANVGTLDFSAVPGFNASSLYAVINVTQNAPLYVAGAPGLGFYSVKGTVCTLNLSTTGMSSSDIINVYYDSAPGTPVSNTPAELGGQLQLMQESMDQILQELKVMNLILAQGLNINVDDVEALRIDVSNVQNYPSTY